MRTTTRKGGNRGGNLSGLGGRSPQSLRLGDGPCIRPPPNILRSSVVGCAHGKSKKGVFLVRKVRSSGIFSEKYVILVLAKFFRLPNSAPGFCNWEVSHMRTRERGSENRYFCTRPLGTTSE